MRRIESDDEFRQLCRLGHGYIYNDFAGLGAGGADYNILHAASCHTLDGAAWSGKFYDENLGSATTWLRKERGAEGRSWKRCGTCEP